MLPTRIVAIISLTLIVAPVTATSEQPSGYSQVVSAARVAVWKECLKQTKQSQGYRIESGHSPYILWLFFDFGDAAHPMSEFAGYAESTDDPGHQYGHAEIKLTVQPIALGRTQISAIGFFQQLALPTSAAFLPLHSKGVLERSVVDSIVQSLASVDRRQIRAYFLKNCEARLSASVKRAPPF